MRCGNPVGSGTSRGLSVSCQCALVSRPDSPCMAKFSIALCVSLFATLLAGCVIEDPTQGSGLEQASWPVVQVFGAVSRLPVAWNGSLPTLTATSTGYPGFEPTMGITSDGAVFFSSIDTYDLETLQGLRIVLRSTDEGLSWTDVTPRLPTGTSFPPRSLDPYVHIDALTDRVFVSQLLGGCATLSWSDDSGATWTNNPFGCGMAGFQDHQTVFTSAPTTTPGLLYPNVVWYCAQRIVDSGCATSRDGGLTFGPFRPLVYNGVEPSTLNPNVADPMHSGGTCDPSTAHGVAAPDGTVYLPTARCGVPMVAATKDEGLTWRTSVISNDVLASDYNGHMAHEVPVTVDAAGTVYATWIDEDRHLRLSLSSDDGATWTTPMTVNPPTIGTTAIPTIVAGADGRVQLAYYGTDQSPEAADIGEGTEWHAYVSVIQDVWRDDPIVATLPVNDLQDPMARGPTSGIIRHDDCSDPACAGIGDFIDAVVGPDGRTWFALIDECVEDCAAYPAIGNNGRLGILAVLR